MNAAPDGSVIQRDAPRAALIAFEIKNKITKPDVKRVSTITDKAMQAHWKIDLPLIMPNYKGSDFSTKFDVQANKVSSFR